MAMVALPAEGQTPEDVARRLAKDVLPAVRAELSTHALSP
jgi:hypothetical protein